MFGLFKKALISQCRAFHKQVNDEHKDNTFAFKAMDSKGNEIARINGIINIVRNQLSTEYFGANITIEYYDCSLPSGSGIVEFILILAEVSDDVKIVEQNILFNKVDPFDGESIDKFIEDFQSHIVEDWNKL